MRKLLQTLLFLNLFLSKIIAQIPTLVRNLNTNDQSTFPGSFPEFFTEYNGNLFFTAITNPLNPSTYSFYKSNGTEAGTTIIKNLRAFSQTAGKFNFIEYNNEIYFTVSNNQLWKSDGTTSGTVFLKTHTANISKMFVANGFLFYSSGELWRTDGTILGTLKLSDTPSGGYGTYANKFYFNTTTIANGNELWISDGNLAGTTLLKDIYPGTANSNPTGFTEYNGFLYFFTWNSLWKTDGTSDGTVLVKNNLYYDGNSVFKSIINVNGTLYFSASTTQNTNAELWKSDGTESGTVLLKAINPTSNSSNIEYFTKVNNSLFFLANDGTHGVELWKSNGTQEGTIMVKDINSGSTSGIQYTFSSGRPLVYAYNGILYFPANDSANGVELWKSDGTATGTVMVADINPGAGSSNPDGFESVNDKLFFAADNGALGRELWMIDFAQFPPNINCSQNILLPVASGINSAIANFNAPIVSGSVVTQIAGLTSGSNFPLGSTTVSFHATNSQNNTATCSFKVAVYPESAPLVQNVIVQNAQLNTAGNYSIASNSFNITNPSGTTVSGILIPEFPVGAESITINGIIYGPPAIMLNENTKSSKVFSTTFPTNGVIAETNSIGEPIQPIIVEPISETNSMDIEYFAINTNNEQSPLPATVTINFAQNPLPLNLISFSGKKQENEIQLNWKTTNERNFSHFEIQKSSPEASVALIPRGGIPKEFGTIGKVNSNESGFYNITDTNPTEGQNYYKLKIIDLDGTSTFSKTISVNFEKNGYYLSVENPTNNGEFLVRSNYEKPTFSLVNSVGSKIEIILTKTEDNLYKIKSKNSTPGLYFLMVEAQGKVLANKVLMY